MDHYETLVTDASWILRHEAPTAAELQQWSAQARTDSTGVLSAIYQDSFATSRPAREQVKLLYKAALGDFTHEDPVDLDFWTSLYTVNKDVGELAASFSDIATSGFRNDPSGLPVDPTRKFQSLAGAADDSVVLSHGTDAHLYCIRKSGTSPGGWEQLDLGAMVDGSEGAYVQAWDARQERGGSFRLAIAIGNHRNAAPSTLYVSGPLHDDPTTMDWRTALSATRAVPVPDVQIERVSLAPDLSLQWGDVVMTGTNTGTRENYRIQLSGAEPQTDKLPIPENAEEMLQLQPGVLVEPGIWSLYLVGGRPELVFTTFLDQFGKTINVPFEGLPAGANSFAILSAGMRDTVIVAGQEIVMYAGSPGARTTVASLPSPATQLHATADSIRYVAGGTLYETTKRGDVWPPPAAILEDVAAMQWPGSTGPAADLWYVTPNRRLLRRRDGAVADAAVLDAVWTVKPLSRAVLDSMVAGHAPVIHLHSEEQYRPAPVESYLAKAGLRRKDADWVVQPGGFADLTAFPQLLPTLPRSTAAEDPDQVQYFLQLPDDALAQLKGGDPDRAVFYGRAKFKELADETHLQVWMFYPYNGPGTASAHAGKLGEDHIDLAPLGEHEGDWEHATLVFANGDRSLKGIYLSQHDSGALVGADQLTRDDQTGRPKLYPSRNGHAVYQSAGTNASNSFSQGALFDFELRNDTDEGLRIDSGEPGRFSLVSAPFLADSRPQEPAWLDVAYRWGKCFDFTSDDFERTFRSIMSAFLPVASLIPIVNVLYPLLMAAGPAIGGKIVADKNSLGGEGHSGGPTGPKQKGNWFGSE